MKQDVEQPADNLAKDASLFSSTADHLHDDPSAGPKTLGPYIVDVKQSRKEKFLAWYGVAALFFVVLIPTLNSASLAYFTKQLQEDCGLTVAQYGLLTGYANGLVYAIASVIIGWGVDHYNWPRTYVLAAASLLLTAMYVVEATAKGFPQLLASVMIAAVGGSVHITMPVSLVSDLLPPESVSLGQAMLFTGEAVAVILAGNIAYAFKQSGTSWRAVPFGLAVASFVVSLAVGVGIREPPKGKFIIKPKDDLYAETTRKFNFNTAMAYVANMRIFWLLILGLGLRMNAGHIILAYMPPLLDALYPTETSLDATFATVVGVFAFLSSVIIGYICEVQMKKRPWMALYTGAYGGLLGCFFFLLTLWSKKIAGDGGYALMLVCTALGALAANGATGPLAALTTLLLPPELKSFALSVYEFLTGLMAPVYSVVMGIGLQAVVAKQTREIGNGMTGDGPANKLEAGQHVVKAAQIFAAVGLLFSFVGSAIFFIPAAWGVLSDIQKQKAHADGTAPPERVRLLRKVVMLAAVIAFMLVVLFLLTISLVASFNPGAVRKHQGG